MALREIRTEGDPILARQCRKVDEITPRIKTLIEDMIETMENQGGVGIAAPQVGIARQLCITAHEEDKIKILINPEILEEKGSVESQEGCLSVPNKIGIVDRPEYIKVKYTNGEGRGIIEELEGFEAIVTCHEMDHLKGELYIDKARNISEVED